MSEERQGRDRAAGAEQGSEVAPQGTKAGAPPSYEAAVERLELIIDRLDSGQAGLRETLDLCREGRGLITYCAGELETVGEGLRELRLDELATRLEAGPGDDPPPS